MSDFFELLTADDAQLLKILYKVKIDQNADFILRINKIADALNLNHTQLICALAFNPNIEDLYDIHSLIGFRSFKILDYRNEELFTTDVYYQLSIESLMDLYSAVLEDDRAIEKLQKLLPKRLNTIENHIDKKEDSNHVMNYRMEINCIYNMKIVNQAFVDERLKLRIGQHRIYSGELKAIIENSFQPVNNLFFMDTLSPLEKKFLIDEYELSQKLIINRLQNQAISKEERDVLEAACA